MSDIKKDFPIKIEKVEESVAQEVRKYYTGERSGFVRVGPHGYFFPDKYCTEAARIHNLPLRPDDVIVATYPRSGTTWTQELVWMIQNNLDYEKSASIALARRYIFVEISALISDKLIQEVQEENRDNPKNLQVFKQIFRSGVDILAKMPSPRFIKTHLPFSLLPQNTLDTCKVVYIARDPRDVAVSFYHHNQLIRFHGFVGDFKTYWKHFINNMYIYAPFFPHVKEAWKVRDHPNLLFLFYEDMVKDLPSVVRRVAKFFGKQYSDEQIDRLCDHLSFKNFKNNKSCNPEFAFHDIGVSNKVDAKFLRQGKSGGWRDFFDEEMTKEAEEWIAENLNDTDLRFPSA